MRKKLLILLCLIVVALIVVGLMLPTFVEDRVESELADRLQARGVEASWTDFGSQFGRTFSIEGLQLRDPARGISVKADSVDVAISIDSFMDAEFGVSSIEIEDLLIHVDIKKLRAKEASEPKTAEGKPRSGLIQRILDNPPEIDVRRARLEVRHGSLTLSEMRVEETKVNLSRNEVTLESTAFYKTLAPVPEFLSAPVDVHVSATLGLKSKDFQFVLSHPELGKPLVRLEDREAGSLTIGTISGDGNLGDRTIRADAETIAIRIGDADVLSGLVASADVHALRFERLKSGRIALLLNTPEVVVTPANAARLRPFLKLVGDTQDFLEDEAKPTKSAAPAPSIAQNQNVLRFARLFTRVLHQQDVQMRDLKFSFNVENDFAPGVYSQITLLERINITTQFGAVFAAGETAGGTIRAEFDFLPGHAFPRYLFVDVDGLRLGKIPGMPKGRTELPSRGTSGRLDGVVSARMSLLGPTVGIGNDLFDVFSGDLSLEWRDGEADFVGVSDEPLTGINLKTNLELTWYPLRQQVLAKNGRFQMGPVRVNYDGEVRNFPMDTLIRGKAEMEEIDCQRAIRTFPSAMLGPYRNIKIDGKWAPTLSVSYPLNRPRRLNFELDGYEEVCDILSLGVPRKDWPEEVKLPGVVGTERADALSDVFWLEKPFIKRITEGLATDESEVFVGPGLPTYVPLDEMPSWVGGAAYLSEEILFYTEHGISLGLLKKALRLNLEKGRFVYGGSTVTQQLIKNLFLTRDKTLSRKLQEALIAWRIAETIPKDRVLELYLNVIEFGPDVYGIGPAAQYYFQKDARNLTPMESIFLAMLKPSPLYGPRVVQRRSTPSGVWWTKRTEELFRRLVEHKHITAEHAEREKPYELKWEKGKYLPRAYEVPLFD